MTRRPSGNPPHYLFLVIVVFFGGALGSLARELLVPLLPDDYFWVPILLVNVLACFLIGGLFALREQMPPATAHFLVGGFCGGFSTFSHFSYELVTLGEATAYFEALVYIGLAVTLGISAAVFGERLGLRFAGGRSAQGAQGDE